MRVPRGAEPDPVVFGLMFMVYWLFTYHFNYFFSCAECKVVAVVVVVEEACRSS